MAQVIPVVVPVVEAAQGKITSGTEHAGQVDRDFREILSRVGELISQEIKGDWKSSPDEAIEASRVESGEGDAVDYVMEVMAALAILFPGQIREVAPGGAQAAAGETFSFPLVKGDPQFDGFIRQIVMVLKKFVESVSGEGGVKEGDFSRLAMELSRLIQESHGDKSEFTFEVKKVSDSVPLNAGKVEGVSLEGQAKATDQVSSVAPKSQPDPSAANNRSDQRVQEGGKVDFVRIKEVAVKGGAADGSGDGTGGGKNDGSGGFAAAHAGGSGVGRSFHVGVKTQGSAFRAVHADLMPAETSVTRGVSLPPRTLALELEPPELGRVLLDLTVRDGVLKAHVRVESQGVKELFSAALPHIRKALEEMGIKPGEFHLSTREEDPGYRGYSWNGGNRDGGKRENPFKEFYES